MKELDVPQDITCYRPDAPEMARAVQDLTPSALAAADGRARLTGGQRKRLMQPAADSSMPTMMLVNSHLCPRLLRGALRPACWIPIDQATRGRRTMTWGVSSWSPKSSVLLFELQQGRRRVTALLSPVHYRA